MHDGQALRNKPASRSQSKYTFISRCMRPLTDIWYLLLYTVNCLGATQQTRTPHRHLRLPISRSILSHPRGPALRFRERLILPRLLAHQLRPGFSPRLLQRLSAFLLRLLLLHHSACLCRSIRVPSDHNHLLAHHHFINATQSFPSRGTQDQSFSIPAQRLPAGLCTPPSNWVGQIPSFISAGLVGTRALYIQLGRNFARLSSRGEGFQASGSRSFIGLAPGWRRLTNGQLHFA